MSTQYGLNLPASNVKQILEKTDKQNDGVRSWQQLLGGASQGFTSKSDALTTDFSSAMQDAYKVNFAQENALAGGGLSENYTQQQIGLNRQELMNTYDKYVQNYGTQLGEAAEGYGQEVGAIQGGALERAENFISLYDSAHKYLTEELYGSTRTSELDDKKQLDYFKENDLDWMLKREGDVDTIMSREELEKIMYDEGQLTQKGKAFYSAMFNARPDKFKTADNKDTRSFDRWLSDTNSDLREWLASEDQFNTTADKTNFGSAKALLGLDSQDYEYDEGNFWKREFRPQQGEKQTYDESQENVWKESSELEGRSTIDEVWPELKTRIEADTIDKRFGNDYKKFKSSVDTVVRDALTQVDEMQEAFSKYYGKEASEELNKVLKEDLDMLKIYSEHMTPEIKAKVKAGETRAKTDYEATLLKMKENTDEFSALYDKILKTMKEKAESILSSNR